MTRKTDTAKNLLAPLMVSLALCATSGMTLRAEAIEASPAATTAANANSVLEPDSKVSEKERKEIEAVLSSLEAQWNAHDLDAVMNHYAEDYINNDGLDKKSVSAITKKFWSQYPDSKSTSKLKQIRIDGSFATVESRDVATGTTDKENQDIGTKGDLNSVSEGQVYLRKFSTTWKIVGDRIDYEKVRVSFGLAKQLNANFSAPEQVKSGRQYSARLEVNLPVGLSAIGSIVSQPLKYPQSEKTSDDEKKIRIIDGESLERVMSANSNNRNELLMATVGITNSTRNNLMGITVFTRRLNVIPHSEDTPEEIAAAKAEAEKAEKEKKAEAAKEETHSTGDKSKVEDKSKDEKPGSGKSDANTESKDKGSDAKTEPKSDSKTDTKDESKSDSKSDSKPGAKVKDKNKSSKKKSENDTEKSSSKKSKKKTDSSAE